MRVVFCAPVLVVSFSNVVDSTLQQQVRSSSTIVVVVVVEE